MCGIFGIVAKNSSFFPKKDILRIIDSLFLNSESRGKEASGLAIRQSKSIKVFKRLLPTKQFINNKEYKELISEISKDFSLIGHTRLITNGKGEVNYNNQPIVKDDIIAVHNGIIVNDQSLWQKYPQTKREYQIDTEILLSLTRLFLPKKPDQKDFVQAVAQTFGLIEGSASVALFPADLPLLLLATNTGSLYYTYESKRQIFIFASEEEILRKTVFQTLLKKWLIKSVIYQIKPQTGLLINLEKLKVEKFDFSKKIELSGKSIKNIHLKIIEISAQKNDAKSIISQKTFSNLPEPNYRAISKLKRCTKCILPETMPFIEFDEEGVCNYCRHYKKMKLFGTEALEKAVSSYRRSDGRPDCLVAFSGGRDSSYGLHYVKKILKMNPVAYSYDWGMLTDLGRRNQSRMCGKLGIEHILISADIRKKRENIRKNVLAWLRKPDLGMIPLFMAGDKQYFYYLNRLRKRMGIDLVFYTENPLEKTDFKLGFCGVKPNFSTYNSYNFLYNIGIAKKIKLASYYLRQFIRNPAYLNSSLIDSFTAYLSSYFYHHNYLYLYQYIKWDEEKINNTLIKKYNWELAEDSKSTWRIGDGTAAFYNYIYYAFAGFTENDTFRSNQIREGIIERGQALKLIQEENKPRFESIKWYCETIGVDFPRIASLSKIRCLTTNK